jgi:hypothetical protein
MYGGNRDMAGWRMIGFPGAHAHFVQWVGRHGIHFDRPPMSIAMNATPPHGGHHGHDVDAHRIPSTARPVTGGSR